MHFWNCETRKISLKVSESLLSEKMLQVSRMFPSRTFIEKINVVPTENFEFE